MTLKTIPTILILVASLTCPGLARATTAVAEVVTTDQAVQAEDGKLDLARQWILSFMVKKAPPGRKLWYPESHETSDEAMLRYRAIADDIIHVVYDPNVKPIFTGKNGRSRTVAIMLSVMLHESSFMRHVDYGLGKYARGDLGRSWCLMQINIGTGRTSKWNRVHDRAPVWGDPELDIDPGHTGDEMIQDRKLCLLEGLKIMRQSFAVCSKLPLEDRLRSYASGSCEKGSVASRARVLGGMRWFETTFKKQFTDAEVQQGLREEPVRMTGPAPGQEVNML